jgi:NADP-dependent 3-hydroxy acid dehydrogenase YdfG
MTNTKPHRSLNRRQAIQAGMAGIAGVTAVGLNSQATAQQPEPAPTSIVPNGRFAGKVVTISGATSGIGRAAALAFAREGAKVGFCGRRENLGAEVERQIRQSGGDATYIKADVTQPQQVESFVNRIVDKYGRLDVAFNNAGDVLAKPLHQISVEEWDLAQNTNLRGVFLAMKYQIPHMLRQGGNIVITASQHTVATRPGFAAYACKTGITRFGTSGSTRLRATRHSGKCTLARNYRYSPISAIDRRIASKGRSLSTVSRRAQADCHGGGDCGSCFISSIK